MKSHPLAIAITLSSIGLLVGCGDASVDTVPPPRLDAHAYPDSDTMADASPTSDAAQLSRIIFVDADADPGGDGRRRTPFQTMGAANAVVRPGDTIQLLPGTHQNWSEPPPGVVVQGSGRDVTRIPGPISLQSARLTLRELTIFGGAPSLEVTGDVLVESVQIESTVAAIQVEGEARFRDVLVRNVGHEGPTSRAFEGPIPSSGEAVLVTAGGRLTWTRGGIHQTEWVGLRNEGDAQLEGVTIRDTAGPAAVNVSGQLELRQVTFTRTAAASLLVLAGEVRVIGAQIQTQQRSELVPLRAGVAAYGGRVQLESISMTDVGRGVRASRETNVSLLDIEINDAASDGVSVDGARLTGSGVQVTGVDNTGVSVVNGGQLNLEDVQVEMAGRIGVLVDDSSGVLNDVRIFGSEGRCMTLSRADGVVTELNFRSCDNVGLQVSDPRGDIVISTGEIVGCGTSGVALTGRQNQIQVDGVAVSQTQLGEAGLAEGFHLYNTDALLTQVTATENGGAGVLVEQSSVSAMGVTSSENQGPGMVLVGSEPGTEISGYIANRNQGAGALVLQGSAQFHDVQVRGTTQSLAIGPGDGMIAGVAATLAVSSALSRGNAGHGFSIQGGCTGELDGVVAEENGGWGLFVACGQSMVSLSGENRFEGNTSGGAVSCP